MGQTNQDFAYSGRALHDMDLVPSSPRGLGETILIVEDDPSVRQVVNDLLCELGYNVLVAPDARAAVPFLHSKQQIHLMVTDVVLPYFSGRKLAEAARDARPDLKILLVSGYAGNAVERGELRGKNMELLSKPFALDAFSAKIRAMLDQ